MMVGARQMLARVVTMTKVTGACTRDVGESAR